MPLRFRVADLQRELRALEMLGRPRIARGSHGMLAGLADDLEWIRQQEQPREWGWAADKPLELELSAGQYQPGAEGGEEVLATIDCVWILLPMTPQIVELSDIASVRISLNLGQLGMWRMEVSDGLGPGPFFHTQIRGQDDAMPWPKSLDVPRFPSCIPTPASVVEFVIGELFQDEWETDLERHKSAATVWLNVQRHWWLQMLSWQQAVVESASSSAWLALKNSAPNREMLT